MEDKKLDDLIAAYTEVSDAYVSWNRRQEVKARQRFIAKHRLYGRLKIEIPVFGVFRSLRFQAASCAILVCPSQGQPAIPKAGGLPLRHERTFLGGYIIDGLGSLNHS